MEKFTLGIVAFPILFSMLALRVPIGLAMLIVGCSGTIIIAGWLPILSQVKTSAWHLFSKPSSLTLSIKYACLNPFNHSFNSISMIFISKVRCNSIF